MIKFKLFGGAEHLRTAVSVNILGNLLAREGDDKAAHECGYQAMAMKCKPLAANPRALQHHQPLEQP